MIVCDKYKFIYIAITKTGTTSIISHLNKYIPNYNDYREIVKKNYNGKVYKHVKAKQLRKLIGSKKYDSYTKFTVVRNPYDRAVSWYEYVYRLSKNNGRSSNGMSFSEFVNLRRNVWTGKQKDYVTDDNGNLIIDHVLNYDNLDNELQNFMKKFGLNIGKLPKLNKSSHRPLNKKLIDYYDDEAKNKVYNVMKDDFDLFGFDKDIPN